jgi:tRNA-dihydrouridine synthase
MIGRMAPANPWIFRQIEQYVSGATGVPARPAERRSAAPDDAGGKPYDEPTEADRYQMIRTYFQMLLEEEMPGAEGKMKQFASWFTHGIPGGAALRKAIYDAKSGAEILAQVEDFFEARLPAQTK